MTLNCKVGDLAIVVRCPTAPANISKFVRIVGVANSDEYEARALFSCHFWWECISESSDGVLAQEDGKLVFSGGREFAFPDAWLRPIRPLDEPETITTDDEVMA